MTDQEKNQESQMVEAIRIEAKHSTELTPHEIGLRQLWKLNAMEKSIKSISGWVTFFGILQIIALVLALLFINKIS